MNIDDILNKLAINLSEYEGKDIAVFTPIDGSILASLRFDTAIQADAKIAQAEAAFHIWRDVPAPERGRLIRLFGEQLRKYKEPLAQLVTIECGKIIEEGRGEVQEMIDICDFAIGLSRQLYGLTIASERPQHVMHENWLPLGPVGVISAFNFPVAIWAWNFALAIICGDTVVWKPSEKTPLVALACQMIFAKACRQYGDVPEGLSEIIIGNSKRGEQLVDDQRIKLISATGSCRMGGMVGQKVAARFGRSLLELGGNNAVIVSNQADIDLAIQSILFGAIGTCGQRCTTTRRVIAHKDIYNMLITRLKTAYQSIAESNIGNPQDNDILVGPLIDKNAYENMQNALIEAKQQGAEVWFGKRVLEDTYPNAYYVEPALVVMQTQTAIVQQETFAPILYVMPYSTLDEAIKMQNDVPHGLSSAIFTKCITEAEHFKRYSDCGIANVNIGTSGAEIGGAFGGEKETGGGREAGSDSWRNYMRRQTSTTYFGNEKPTLAQGIKFEIA